MADNFHQKVATKKVAKGGKGLTFFTEKWQTVAKITKSFEANSKSTASPTPKIQTASIQIQTAFSEIFLN
jgi:hypothetical protein